MDGQICGILFFLFSSFYPQSSGSHTRGHGRRKRMTKRDKTKLVIQSQVLSYSILIDFLHSCFRYFLEGYSYLSISNKIRTKRVCNAIIVFFQQYYFIFMAIAASNFFLRFVFPLFILLFKWKYNKRTRKEMHLYVDSRITFYFQILRCITIS